jgi:hypothetical protein
MPSIDSLARFSSRQSAEYLWGASHVVAASGGQPAGGVTYRYQVLTACSGRIALPLGDQAGSLAESAGFVPRADVRERHEIIGMERMKGTAPTEAVECTIDGSQEAKTEIPA